MKKITIILLPCLALMPFLIINSVLFKFSLFPLDKYTLFNSKGLPCGEGRLHLQPFSFVQIKLYVGGYANSSDPEGYEYSIVTKGRKINIYRIQDGYAIAEEKNARLVYGWTSERFSSGSFEKICENNIRKNK